MLNKNGLVRVIADELAQITESDVTAFDETTALIGQNASIKSRHLVELLLFLEDYMDAEHGVEFEWASDSAMSEARSAYRTIGSLAERLAGLVQA